MASARLNGTLVDDGGEACDVRFQYGETIVYDIDTEWQSGKESVVAFEQAITGLSSGTTYHFRAVAKNTAGTGYGADRTFTTLFVCPCCDATFATREERDAHIASEHVPITVSRAYALSREEL